MCREKQLCQIFAKGKAGEAVFLETLLAVATLLQHYRAHIKGFPLARAEYTVKIFRGGQTGEKQPTARGQY